MGRSGVRSAIKGRRPAASKSDRKYSRLIGRSRSSLQQGRQAPAYDGGRFSPYWDGGTVHLASLVEAAMKA
ncbi:MAG: hypothetical protein P8Q36_03380 [Alphaproteobacteria bacterium]|nr:hypothetical protein [Rhodospirillaceae bacterium]MBT6202577.1 hypothetical protein [Rhodospirillaceae bacterium]MBT6510597.1 hypothetical protein [Rhodospirillaceae bacterium]MDG2479900.1 hypothetical protein [Alphaproteobacteria bacterium]